MKIKSMAKYSLNNLMRGYLIFFGLMFVIINAAMILTATTNSTAGILGGMDFATIVFLVVIGWTNYKDDIAMSVQNGVSRKSYFCATAIAFVIIALTASVGDTILSVIGNFYQTHINGMNYDSSYEQIFLTIDYDVSPIPAVIDYFKAFVYQFTFDLFAISGGFLMGAVIYRLPKVLKFIIPTVLYIVIFVISPILALQYFDIAFIDKLAKLGAWIIKSSWNMSLTFVIATVLSLAIAYPFIRRVSINERK